MLGALRERLPEHVIQAWPDVTEASKVRHTVVWMPPENFFDGLSNLKHIHAVAAGVDQLLTHPGLPTDAAIYRLEDAGMGVKMSEYVLYGVLHAHRRFPTLQEAQREGRWARETRTASAARWQVGILGAGFLGSMVASRLVQNGYPVTCWSRTSRALPEGVSGSVGRNVLPGFLEQCNVLVCLLPLTDQTRGILNMELFKQLPDGAFLINPGRGEHLIESDLSAALDTGKLSGALLDVFATEPLPESHPFWSDPRVLITPHLAAPSPIRESMTSIASTIAALDDNELSGESSSAESDSILLDTARVDRNRGY